MALRVEALPFLLSHSAAAKTLLRGHLQRAVHRIGIALLSARKRFATYATVTRIALRAKRTRDNVAAASPENPLQEAWRKTHGTISFRSIRGSGRA